MTDFWPDPGELLMEVRPQKEQTGGKLKIFFGYAAGVGKTYAMLEAAHHAKSMGADVVAGYIEPHTRPETQALLEGLERLPPRRIPYKGIQLQEFDLDGALERRPQLLLVDELAHTNAAGCCHLKRYQDIEELLRAGINVYTTINVQYLESLHDIVAAISGVSIRERVPDKVFDSADQVELVDIEPADLLERLRAGKIYRPAQARRAEDHFFTQKNLAALREIALRRTADRLSRTSEAAGRPSVGDEHVLTCLSASPSSAKVIRTAARMAEAFHSEFTALFVETPDFQTQNAEDRRRLRANLRLAEELGARIATAYGDDAAVQIAEYARTAGVSKIVLGRSNRKRSLRTRGRSLVDRLTECSPDLDIYIIPDNQPAYRPREEARRWYPHFSWADAGKTALCLALATVVGWLFYLLGFSEANIVTVYILGVLFTSVWTGGRGYGAAASLVSVLVYNFFFTVPRFTLLAYDPGYPLTFAVMLVASLVTSSLTLRVKSQARQAAQKAYRTQVLLETSQKLQKAEGETAILDTTAGQLRKLLERTVLFYPVNGGQMPESPRVYPVQSEEDTAIYLRPEERTVACWVQKNNKHAGATTNTLPSARCLYLAVRGERGVLAVAGISMAERAEPDAFEKNLMIAILDECGLVLEKTMLDRARREIEEKARQEALRANLLRAISHDLRTPLTSISGNAGILVENSALLDESKRHELYLSIYDDSMWLTNLVENLLSVTRIENGTMELRMQPELLDEVFQEALAHLDRHAPEHRITVELGDDLLMARMDARLMVQVVINLVNNAIKYTPPGSNIVLSAARRGDMVEVRVADDGPGVGPEAKSKIFDMFYTANNDRGDGRRGLGLGLSLCRSIVTAHGGTISVEDNAPHGAVFMFTLHSAEVNPIE